MLDKYTIIWTLLLSLVFVTAGMAQDHEVTGTVTDAGTGSTLPGVNVVIEGTTQGTVTNVDGNYSINVPSSDVTLIFTYIGYERLAIPVNGRNVINAELTQQIFEADALVVVGYGVQEKVNLTGAVSTVSAEEIQNRSIASVEEALQGTVSGLNMVRTGGQPGNQNIDIRIRGTSTFTDNPALIVIDGIPSAQNNLDRLNPTDIESISVLKDASSTAIYGSRATGGVILITTKSGEKGQPQFDYSSTVGIQSPTRFPEKVSALNHALLSNEARANEGGTPKYIQSDIERFSSPDWEDYDWDEFFLENSFQTNQNIGISGGSDSHNYFLSFGYLKQDGVVLNSDFERYNLRFNQNVQVSERFDINLNVGYAPSTRTQSPDLNSALNDIHVMPKTEPIQTDNGDWAFTNFGTGLRTNPIAMASDDAGELIVKSNHLTGNAKLDYQISKKLVLSGIYGIERNQTWDRGFRKILTLFDPNDPEMIAEEREDNFLDINNSINIHQNINFLANYINRIKADHNLTILGGVSAEWFEQHNNFVGTRDFLTDNIFTISAGTSDPTLWNISGGASDWALASLISRATYSFRDRYLFEAAVRYDGSSRFKEDLRWGLFPSVSAGWILSDENFLQEAKALTFLKLKGSWGQVGNQNVGFYPFANTLSQSAYYFNGSPQRAVATAGAPNPLLTWETKEAINLGIEGSLFENIFEFEFNIFNEKTNDILLQLPLPSTFGQQEPVQNAGRVDNRGWEVDLRHRNTMGNFSYGISVQVSNATNEVIDMGGISPRIQSNTITEEGRPMNEWFGLEVVGNMQENNPNSFFQNDQEIENHAFQNPQTSPGDLKYIDQNGDGVINSDDRVRLGRSDPQLPFGISFNLNYKNFDFKAFGQGVMKHTVWSSGWTAVNFERENSTLRTYHLNRWTPDNPDALFPQTRFGSGSAKDGINDRFSSFWLEDASYFRIKQIEVGYNIPQGILDKFNMRGSRVFINAENLFTITNYTGYDPEIATGIGGNLVQGRYPLSRVISFGINLKF